jgi:BirA family transcriptional regulator, biotin operon repressor / biotin---[acetyl-CoA-carboxylase] ligase
MNLRLDTRRATRHERRMLVADIPVLQFDTIDSTNSEAMRRIAEGERGPLWVVAGAQTAGKGRSGRGWVSHPGNFYGSLIVSLDAPARVAPQLSLVTAVAVHDAIVAAAAPLQVDGLRLKWPNDVLIGHGKLAGLLAESTTTAEGRLVAVLGIGVNIAAPPDDLGRAIASLAGAGVATSPATLLRHLSNALTVWLTRWSRGSGYGEVRAAWRDRAGSLGEPLTVHVGATGNSASDTKVSGRFAGLADDGALLLSLDDGTIRRVTFGDVTLRTAGTAAAD